MVDDLQVVNKLTHLEKGFLQPLSIPFSCSLSWVRSVKLASVRAGLVGHSRLLMNGLAVCGGAITAILEMAMTFQHSICLTYLSMHGSLLGDFRSFELVGLKPVKPEFFFFFFLWLSFRWTVMFLTVILHKLHFSSAILRSEVGELFSTGFPIHRSGQAVFTS